MNRRDRKTSHQEEEEAGGYLAFTLAPQIDSLRQRWEVIPDYDVAPGSSLAGDDRHSKPYQVSHGVWLSITTAIDNLCVLRAFTVPGEGDGLTAITRPYGVYPLLRAAMENASAALWVLGPGNRNARLIRHIRLLLTEGQHRDEVDRLTGQGSADARRQYLDAILPLISLRDLDTDECQKWISFRKVVSEAAEVKGAGDPVGARVAWHVLSGLTHGDRWAMLAMTDREVVEVNEDDDTYTLSVTSSVSNIARFTEFALRKTVAALNLYDLRRMDHLGSLPGVHPRLRPRPSFTMLSAQDLVE